MLLSKIEKVKDFLIVKALKQEMNSTVYIIIASNPVVAIDAITRNQLQQDQDSWRWAAGGTAVILQLKDCNILTVIQRGASAPSYQNHDEIGSGLSATIIELLNPLQIAFREGVEEIFITTPNEIIYPDLQCNSLNFKDIVKKINNNLYPNITLPLKSIPAQILEFPQEQPIVISWEKTSVKRCKALVTVDPTTRGIDLLKVIKLTIPYYLHDITVLGGEGGNGKTWNPIAHAYELNSKFAPTGKMIMSWVNGEKKAPPLGSVSDRKKTPVLKTIYEVLETLS